MNESILFDQLTRLRLPAFREGLQEQRANPQYAEMPFEERLALLVDRELGRRHNNRIARHRRAAKFPVQAALEDFDLTPERGLDRRYLLELGQGTWLENRLNLLILGATGVGKSFLACAFGTTAIRLGYTARYFRTARLLHAIHQARQDQSYSIFIRSLARIDLLILDDWLRDPLTSTQAQDLLDLFDDRYAQASTIVTAQIPVTEWFSQITDPTLADAILDRLIHNAHRLQLTGESQRKLRAIRSMPHT